MPVHKHRNRVSVEGNFSTDRDLRQFCAALYNVIEKQGWSDVVLDFSRCDAVMERVMLPIMPIIFRYRLKENIDFKLLEPLDEGLRRLFINTNWGHFICPEYEHRTVLYEGGHVPASQYENTAKMDELHKEVMDLVFGTLQVKPNNLKVVEWSLMEIMDNVLNHAESSVGGFVQATLFQKKNQIEFVVADAGIGIPESMKQNDPGKALGDSIIEGSTRDKQNNAGNGLYGSYQSATLSGGQFEIHSYHGWLFQSGMKKCSIKEQNIPYCGTSVRCAIELSDPDLLEKALRFKGNPYDPHSCYLDKKYEYESELVVFRMREEAGTAFGSRAGGRRVRTIIKNLLMSGERIIIDLEGVRIFSSSFADEVFGRLFMEMGFHAFTKRIEMSNIDSTVGGLIDRAIEQRIKLGNGESD